MLVKAGAPVESTIDLLMPLLEKGDIIIDGGNEWYENTEHRQKKVAEKGLMYLGMGVSGGEEGARNGELPVFFMFAISYKLPPLCPVFTQAMYKPKHHGHINAGCVVQQPHLRFGSCYHEQLCCPLAVFTVVIATLLL